MIVYEDYGLPCNLLESNNSVAGNAHLRSKFSNMPTQRETYDGYTQSGFSINLTKDEVFEFKQFWYDLNNGADRFSADLMVHGNKNISKVLRFTDKYVLKNLGAYNFKITCAIEIISFGVVND